MDKFLTYVSKYGGSPKPGVISSKPSVGGEYMNMYGLPSDRKYLIETEEGNLMGICDKTNKLCKFDIIDDTYIIQIPSILKLKAEIDKSPKDKIDPNFKVKSRFYK
tara:strand:+ start:349 stop:666 length:318 start_codon:yes stop_codon:yes gene_type:complete